MSCVFSTQGKNKLRQSPGRVLSFPMPMLRWRGGWAPQHGPGGWNPLIHSLSSPLFPLSHPHSLVRSNSGAQIISFQCCNLSSGGLVTGLVLFCFFSRHFYALRSLYLEDSSVSRYLLWRNNKQKHLCLLGPTFLLNLFRRSFSLSTASDFLLPFSWCDFSHRLITYRKVQFMFQVSVFLFYFLNRNRKKKKGNKKNIYLRQ